MNAAVEKRQKMSAQLQGTLNGSAAVDVEPPRRPQRRRLFRLEERQDRSQAQLTTKKTFEQIETENTVKGELTETEELLQYINEVLAATDDDLLMVCLAVERYCGNNLPWFLNLANGNPEVDDSEFPDPENFDIGYYGHEQQPGTREFIRARCTWAKKFYEIENSERQKTVKTFRAQW